MKGHYVAQVDERDCGAAALAMVLAANGRELSIAKIRRLIKTNLDGSSALGIKLGAESLGMEVTAIRADLGIFNNLDELRLPAIAHVHKPDGQHVLEHYYVVDSVTATTVTILDPDNQVRKKMFTKEEFNKQWTGVLLFFKKTEAFVQEKGGKTKGLRSFFPMVFQQRRLILEILLSTIVITGIAIAGSGFLQLLVDRLIPAQNPNLLTVCALGMVGAYVFQQGLTFLQQILLVTLGQRLAREVLLPYARHLFEVPMDFYYTRRVGEITSRFNDANTIIEAVTRTVLSLVLDAFAILIMGVVLFCYSPLLCLLAFLAVPAYALLMGLFVAPLHKKNFKLLRAGADVESAIIENVSGMETIKALGAELQSFEKVERFYNTFLQSMFKKNRVAILEEALKSALKLGFQVLVLWQGARLVMSGELTVGELVAFNALLSYFTEPLQTILALQGQLQTAVVASKRLNEVFEVPSEFMEKPAPHRAGPPNDSLQPNRPQAQKLLSLQNIRFGYQYQRSVINRLTLQIGNGEKLAIVGVSGSGKSTLAKLIVGFLELEDDGAAQANDGAAQLNTTARANAAQASAAHPNITAHPTNGAIYYNGQNIRQMPKEQLREAITYVPQEAQLFTGSVLDNLLLGCQQPPSKENIVRACETAGIYEDIRAMPQGFHSALSPTGSLSGGQRQRLALARALLQNSRVLILDESTSNLDLLTEKEVVDRLLKIKDKTIIFVAHRLTIAERVDRVVMLQDGGVVGDGPHAKLLQENQAYRTLVNK